MKSWRVEEERGREGERKRGKREGMRDSKSAGRREEGREG
jgi:hypothetical protein